MDKIEIEYQKELEKCHKELTDNFTKFAAGEYNVSFEETVHKLIMAEEEHEKKKKKWKTFNYLQKQLKLKKEKKIFIPVIDVTESAAPGPSQIQTSLDSEEQQILIILPKAFECAAPHESAAPGPY